MRARGSLRGPSRILLHVQTLVRTRVVPAPHGRARHLPQGAQRHALPHAGQMQTHTRVPRVEPHRRASKVVVGRQTASQNIAQAATHVVGPGRRGRGGVLPLHLAQALGVCALNSQRCKKKHVSHTAAYKIQCQPRVWPGKVHQYTAAPPRAKRPFVATARVRDRGRRAPQCPAAGGCHCSSSLGCTSGHALCKTCHSRRGHCLDPVHCANFKFVEPALTKSMSRPSDRMAAQTMWIVSSSRR